MMLQGVMMMLTMMMDCEEKDCDSDDNDYYYSNFPLQIHHLCNLLAVADQTAGEPTCVPL